MTINFTKKNRPLIIGITGGIGGGKSTFASVLQEMGELVYNTDLQARYLQDEDEGLVAAIKREFGERIYIDGRLDRKVLGQIVFTNPDNLKVLTDLVHPVVKDDFLQWVDIHSERQFLFMECAVLFEGGFDHLVDKIIVVTAPEPIRIERVMKRDGVSELEVRSRMNNQYPESLKENLADWIFDTSDGASLEKGIKELLAQLR